MNSDSALGSLRVVPRDPAHVHGDGDDGTTTRAGKWAAACGGINLRAPVRSMRRHGRTRIVVLMVGVGVLLGMTATMIARMV